MEFPYNAPMSLVSGHQKASLQIPGHLVCSLLRFWTVMTIILGVGNKQNEGQLWSDLFWRRPKPTKISLSLYDDQVEFLVLVCLEA